MVEDWLDTFRALLQLYTIRSLHDSRLCVRAPCPSRWPVQGLLRTLPIVETSFRSLHIIPRQRDAKHYVYGTTSRKHEVQLKQVMIFHYQLLPNSFLLDRIFSFLFLVFPCYPSHLRIQVEKIDEYSYLVLVSE